MRYTDQDFPLKIERYQRRFLNEAQLTRLMELWRTSAIPCGRSKRYDRMIQTVRWFEKEFPTVKGAYKELDSYLTFSGL